MIWGYHYFWKHPNPFWGFKWGVCHWSIAPSIHLAVGLIPLLPAGASSRYLFHPLWLPDNRCDQPLLKSYHDWGRVEVVIVYIYVHIDRRIFRPCIYAHIYYHNHITIYVQVLFHRALFKGYQICDDETTKTSGNQLWKFLALHNPKRHVLYFSKPQNGERWCQVVLAVTLLLLMAETLHQLIGSLSHYLQGFIRPRWFSRRISAINGST